MFYMLYFVFAALYSQRSLLVPEEGRRCPQLNTINTCSAGLVGDRARSCCSMFSDSKVQLLSCLLTVRSFFSNVS
jgi:hypothetical protein